MGGKRMTTWRELIEREMVKNGESWANVISEAIGTRTIFTGYGQDWTDLPGDLDDHFDNGFGGIEGCSFAVWTRKYVYFPCVYDGAEWCGSVSRYPNYTPIEHIGMY